VRIRYCDEVNGRRKPDIDDDNNVNIKSFRLPSDLIVTEIIIKPTRYAAPIIADSMKTLEFTESSQVAFAIIRVDLLLA
jgi:hypothetical protein